jgi:hypothetical protein
MTMESQYPFFLTLLPMVNCYTNRMHKVSLLDTMSAEASSAGTILRQA